jgi:hypothetical protein
MRLDRSVRELYASNHLFMIPSLTWITRELILLTVASKPDLLPGGYRILIAGGAINGLLEGGCVEDDDHRHR